MGRFLPLKGTVKVPDVYEQMVLTVLTSHEEPMGRMALKFHVELMTLKAPTSRGELVVPMEKIVHAEPTVLLVKTDY